MTSKMTDEDKAKFAATNPSAEAMKKMMDIARDDSAAERAKLAALDPMAAAETIDYGDADDEATIILNAGQDDIPAPISERGVNTMLVRALEGMNAALRVAEDQKIHVTLAFTKHSDNGSVVHVRGSWQSLES